MHPRLAQTFDLLDFKETTLTDSTNKPLAISRQQQVEAFFSYLNLAGYLDDTLLEKAIDYLSLAGPFDISNDLVKKNLKETSALARQTGKFNPMLFGELLTKHDYLSISDIIDLLIFLQQTAFDRQFGQERDRLQSKPWLIENANEFTKLATLLGVTTKSQPNFQHYCGIGIMGGASFRVETRINYLRSIFEKLSYDSVWAITTAERELSKGLDNVDLVEKVAEFYNKPVKYTNKVVGKDSREFADKITESMMVKYLIQSSPFHSKITMIDSAVQAEHWRSTTHENAIAIAKHLLDMIERKQVKPNSNGTYSFMIIAEQPFTNRMTRQVQRVFNAEAKKLNIAPKIVIEGCGPEFSNYSPEGLASLNSELAALAAERFNDARIKLNDFRITLRDPKIIMFSSRKDFYQQLLMNQTTEKLEAEKKVEEQQLPKPSLFSNSKNESKTSPELSIDESTTKMKASP